MRCPRCLFEGNLANGRCVRCGYQVRREFPSSPRVAVVPSTPSSSLPKLYSVMRGDTLSGGRYRILGQISLPEPQQEQGMAWDAIAIHLSNTRVVIREIVVSPAMTKTASVDHVVSETTQRLQRVGQYEGFPKVIDLFHERQSYFMALIYPEGESLVTLFKRHGGALPEPQVAEYGFQLCGLLSLLAEQQPPIVHGSINPDTIIISENGQVSLIHLPLFHPHIPSTSAEKLSSAYYAPEQIRGEIDPSSDLYGLAATMHHAVTGYDPHARLTFFHPPARRLNPAVTTQMEMILARQLSLSKSQRYAHPGDMQKDLAALIASCSELTSDELPTSANDLRRLSATQLHEQMRSNTLLNTGVFAAISVLLLIGVLLALLHP